MTLWAITCACGFNCYRNGPATQRNTVGKGVFGARAVDACPKCDKKLTSTQVPEGNRIMVQEANGVTSEYIDGQWVTVDAEA